MRCKPSSHGQNRSLSSNIKLFYPAEEGRVRPSVGHERMLRTYISQQCFGLSDEAMEDTIYDIQAIRGFVCIDLNREAAPDATTLLKFRHMLETHKLSSGISNTINRLLQQKGLLFKEGSIVDVTLIAAPTSTKNSKDERDPDMHSTGKGNQWHFGMKAHIGVDAESGIVHTLVTTTANVHDVTQAHALLHCERKVVFCDAGYQGFDQRTENRATETKCQIAAP